MGFLRRIAGLLGLGKEEEAVKEQEDDNNQTHQNPSNFQHTPKPFTLPPSRPPSAPVLAPCSSRDGGVQGLRWYARRLRMDEDGDVADEFFDEVIPDTSSSVGDQQKPMPRFEVKYKTRPAKIRNQVISHDGRIQHGVEYQGRLQWV